MLNVDWFKPCKHTEYSVGAIYLTIMNLPRILRFQQENVILIGLIPGSKEPSRNINPFLVPLVKQLQSLLYGVEIYIQTLCKSVLVRCALLCVACDIPASRKVRGFLGHSATLGCSKCLKQFPGQVGRKDYSGFDRSQWKARTFDCHKKCINTIQKSKTKKARNDLELKFGCRYSVLLDLPYFNPIRMTIIDPMHNLYLGSAKLILKKVWIDKGIIDSKTMNLIQDRVNSISTPHYVGRIPHKIISSFSGFTADQFKNWTNLFSIMALHDILPNDHMKCWQYFVQASRILCQMSLTAAQIHLADAFLLQFCCKVETLYGKTVITPNMHLHCHLKQSLLDYGPMHNFWLFSYERYNGILENYPSNNRSIEIHFMQRFIQESFLYANFNALPIGYREDFLALFQRDMEPSLQGSLKVTVHGKTTVRFDPHSVENWSLETLADISFPKSYFRFVLSDDRLSQVKHLYSSLYPSLPLQNVSFNTTCKKFLTLTFNGMRYKENSLMFATSNACIYCGYSSNIDFSPRPILIKHFISHSYSYNDIIYTHRFVVVSWLRKHPAQYHYVKPFEIWWKDLYDSKLEDLAPFQLLISHAVHCNTQYQGQTVCLVCPVQNIPPIGY